MLVNIPYMEHHGAYGFEQHPILRKSGAFFFQMKKKGVGICWHGQRLHLTCSWGSVGQLQSIAHQEAAGKKSQQRGTKHVLPP